MTCACAIEPRLIARAMEDVLMMALKPSEVMCEFIKFSMGREFYLG